MTDLTTQSPAEVDTALAAVYDEIAKADLMLDRAFFSVAHYAAEYMGRKGYREPAYTKAEVFGAVDEVKAVDAEGMVEALEGMKKYDAERLLKANAAYEEAVGIYRATVAKTAPYDAEFARRGGWTRAFLVNNSNGHVHSSMGCSTCFPTTSYCWLPEVSGHDETEIVEKAGERACTVCYPSAPVEVLSRPTQFFTPDEVAKAAARVAREEKRAAKEASKVTVTDVQGWTNERGGVHVYPTPRGATNALAGLLGDIACWGGNHPSVPEWEHNIGRIREALDAKGVEYDFDKMQAAATKKYRNR